jgi:uncharacterized protein DUF3883
MKPLDFQELVRKREDWVRVSKENKFDFDSILAGLYNDPSHFIFEILQNAEDVGAKTVTFKVYEDRLEIFHNGKDFDADNINAITGIGLTTKKEDINSIGKFGVGFKSVFAITQSPAIHSGQYHFEIKDFVLPSLIEGDDQADTTNIILPFNHKFRSQDNGFGLVKEKLENLGLRSLLFLRNIEEIQWQSPNRSGHYLKSSENVDSSLPIKRVAILAKTDNEEILQEDYLVVEKIFELDSKLLKVEVAFQVGKEDGNVKDIIVPVSIPKLSVYFPTEKETHLKFLVQGPYKTTPNRENIPLDDEQNKFITEQLGELVSKSISILKQLDYLDLNLLNILPIEKKHVEGNPIYSAIYEKVKSKLLSDERLLPTHDGQFTTAKEALLPRSKELVEIFDKEDIQFLFEKNNWLDTRITSDQTREIRDYLVNILNIQGVDFESFVGKFTVDFFNTKDDKWMIDFYRRLNNQEALWRDGKSYPYRRGILRSKPFVRLEDDVHEVPFTKDEAPLVYLPSETKSNYPTIKKTIAKDKEALEFLRSLGLSEPDLFAEIREFVIPKYKSDNPSIEDDEYFDDFQKLLLGFKGEQSTKRQELLSNIHDSRIIQVFNQVTNQKMFVKPKEAYENTSELRVYFERSESAYFVSEELHSRFDEKKLDDLLRELGVSHQPKRIGFHPDLASNSELRSELQHQSGNFVSEKDVTDYSLDGLKLFFEQALTLDRSRILWGFLIQIVESKTYGDVKAFFQGEYKWFYYKNRNYKFTAFFTKLLRQELWLFDRQGNLRQPSEITISDLSDEYGTDHSNLDVLKEVLGFKSDVFEQLPEDEKNILEITKGRSLDEIKKALTLLDEQNTQEDSKIWEPEIEPDKVNGNIENLNPETLPPLELENQIARTTTTDSSKPETPKTTKSAHAMKDIGRWGEEYVFNALKARLGNDTAVTETDFGYRLANRQVEIEVHWLNTRGDSGKGYDFTIRQAEKEIEYIEVKTTVESNEELIIISGTQWEFARKLFNSGEGDKYVIYRVFNAGKSDVRIITIRNPVKLWQEGKLYAHPVNLML